MLKEVIEKLIKGNELTYDEARMSFVNLTLNTRSAYQIASFLTALASKGVSLDELKGFHSVMFEKMIHIDLDGMEVVDLCGTGGDGKDTFNISTTASFVLAGCGVKVAKHGNYTFSSKCGSSNLLESLGIKFTNDQDSIRKSLEKSGIVFLHAPLFHPEFKGEILEVRRALKIRTVFNMLGPLLNPCAPTAQMIGVSSPFYLRMYSDFFSEFFQKLKTRASIVYSNDGYDEISLTSSFNVATKLGIKSYTPESIGFKTIQGSEIKGRDLNENKDVLLAVLNGTASKAQKDVVIANAAFALKTFKEELSLDECILRAQESLESKKAIGVLNSLIS